MYRLLFFFAAGTLIFGCTNSTNKDSGTTDPVTPKPVDTPLVKMRYDSAIIALADSATLLSSLISGYHFADSTIVPDKMNAVLKIQTGGSAFPAGIMGKVVAYSVKWQEAEPLMANTEVSIRFSHDKLRWEPWTVLKIDKEDASSSDTVFYTRQEFLTDTFSFYQLQIESNKDKRGFMPGFFRVLFINPGVTPALTLDTSSIIPSNALCPCPLPPFLTRTQWGCETGQNSPGSPPEATQVTHLIIHHSEGANNRSDWPAVIRSIWVDHLSRKFGDIAYNWIIDPNGVLYEGRAGSNNGTRDIKGSHMCKRNSGTMGVCLLGNYMATNITPKAKATLIKLLTWKCCSRNINPLGKGMHAASGVNMNYISGHRSGCGAGYTDCPGNKLFQNIPSIRTSVADSLSTCTKM